MGADLSGQTAIVTGGVRGIGLGVARRFAARGCSVVLWDIDPDAFGREEAGFAPSLVQKVDVSDEGSVERAAKAVIEHRGGVDILVNSAGINGPVLPVRDYPLKDWQQVLAIDLTGVFLCCRAIVPTMVERGYGRIVNVASIAGKEGTPGVSAYCAAKSGVIGFTKALAREVVTSGITVNAVTPVMADTAILAQMTPEHIALTKAKIPMGRFVTVEEIAATIAWAASPDCSFTTGSVFDISGGRADYLSIAMTTPLRIGIIGFGYIGRRHADWICDRPDCTFAGVADPSEQARSDCEARSVFWAADHRELLDRVDAAVIATPNHLHLPSALDCFERRLPVLIEKPLAETAEAAVRLAVAARRAGSPTLVGYYRRHHPAVREARRAIRAGELGRIVTASLRLTFLKPDDYFAPEWRRTVGGGPVLINSVHDIDALRYLVGEITSVQALLSSDTRGFEVEDSAGMLFQFESGAIGTVILSDAVASPYSWDLNAAEDVVYPVYGKDAYVIGGERASLSLPDLRCWRYDGARGWREPLTEGRLSVAAENPYVAQWAHFARVARGEEAPLVSSEDAARTQIVAEAVLDSGRSGARITMAERYAALDRALA